MSTGNTDIPTTTTENANQAAEPQSFSRSLQVCITSGPEGKLKSKFWSKLKPNYFFRDIEVLQS